MSYYVSSRPDQSLIDYSKVIIGALGNKVAGQGHLYIHGFTSSNYKLGGREETLAFPIGMGCSKVFDGGFGGSISYCKKALSLTTILNTFEKYAGKEGARTNHKPQEALNLLRTNITAKYYSGAFAKIKSFLNDRFNWQSSDYKALMAKIDSISAKVSSLSPKEKSNLLKNKIKALADDHSISYISRARKVFSGNLRDLSAIGTIGDFDSQRYSLEWMSPREYLNRVDPFFKRHTNEESMPWIAEKMIDLVYERGTTKFSPLMMNPHVKSHIAEDYYILDHEGRHRALVAERLGLHEIPVAIRHGNHY